jgi:DNA-binding CsgD family transcriptional regulator
VKPVIHSVVDDGSEPEEEIEVGAPIHSLSSSEMTDILLESLDSGIVLVSPDAKILRLNRVALQMLSAFGHQGDFIPSALWEGLKTTIEAAKAVPGRFTPASPLTSPDRRGFFVRCRFVRASAIVITISPAALREIEVQRVLADRFGLNAQEIRIAFFAAQGYRNREIAERLSIVEGTVKNYLTAVFAALSVRSRTELAIELSQLIEEQTDVHRK